MLSKVIAQANIDHAEKWFERADKIVIVTHVSPDGDAIGSSLGLWHFLESQEKTVNVIVPNAFPDFLRWMPGAKDIIRYDKYTEFANKLLNEADVICCLDFNALSRIDAMADAVAQSPARKMMPIRGLAFFVTDVPSPTSDDRTSAPPYMMDRLSKVQRRVIPLKRRYEEKAYIGRRTIPRGRHRA